MSQAKNQNLLVYMSGGFGACAAATFSNPFEVIKTRFQLQGEHKSNNFNKPYKNIFQAAALMAKEEGIFSLQKGLSVAYMYQLVMNGIRFSVFDYSKLLLSSNEGTLSSNFINTLLGAGSGLLAAAVASPLYLIKTRIQARSTSSISVVGTQHQYTGALQALRSIYKEFGFKGLYQGTTPAMVRTMVGSAVQLNTYSQIKGMLINRGYLDDFKTYTISSFVTSFFVCAAMNPFDVITTRMYSQNLNKESRKGVYYQGLVSCLVSTVKDEGIRGLFKGITAHYLRIGPHVVFTFIFMEKFKAMFSRTHKVNS